MAAGIWNPTMEQGETWVRVVTFTDGNNAAIDMTDWTARMTIRNQYTSAALVAAVKAVRDAQQPATAAVAGITGTVTI